MSTLKPITSQGLPLKAPAYCQARMPGLDHSSSGSCGTWWGSCLAAVWLTQLATQMKSAPTLPAAMSLSGAGLAYTPGRAPPSRTVVHQAFVYSTVGRFAPSQVGSSTSRQSGTLPE